MNPKITITSRVGKEADVRFFALRIEFEGGEGEEVRRVLPDGERYPDLEGLATMLRTSAFVLERKAGK